MPRATCHTAIAAAMAVGSELARRGYDVAFTLGNTPRIDLLCNLPGGSAFKIQVKGISNPNGFYVQGSFFRKHDPQLFLVVVYVPPVGDDAPFRFFILSHKQAITEAKKMPTKTRDGRVYEDGAGLNWGSVTPYESCWDAFPQLR